MNKIIEKTEESRLKKIEIEEQSDGNWIGKMYKNGAWVNTRQVDPITVLQTLITHE